MKYATNQFFNGQRASLGRVAIICVLDGYGEPELRPALIEVIGEDDAPRFAVGPLRFHSAASAADVEAMPPGTWTWPPRVS